MEVKYYVMTDEQSFGDWQGQEFLCKQDALDYAAEKITDGGYDLDDLCIVAGNVIALEIKVEAVE